MQKEFRAYSNRLRHFAEKNGVLQGCSYSGILFSRELMIKEFVLFALKNDNFDICSDSKLFESKYAVDMSVLYGRWVGCTSFSLVRKMWLRSKRCRNVLIQR